MKKQLSMTGVLLSLILVGCGTQTTTDTETSNTPKPDTSSNQDVTNNDDTTTTEVGNTESDTNVDTEVTADVQVYEFNEPYTYPNGAPGSVQGNLTVENGVIQSIEFINPTGRVPVFAEGVNEKIIGKQLEGLQIDIVTGASLTTAAFNNFLDDF